MRRGSGLPQSSSDARRLDCSILAVLSLILSYPLYLRGLSPLDEGALLHIAERISGGEVLYRDLATGVMPGVYYLLALVFRLFGPSIEAGRYLQMALLGVNCCLFYLIAEHFLRRPARLTAALLYLSVTLFAFRFPNYSILSIFFLHLGFLFFLRFSRDDKLSWLTLSSLALSCAFLAKQNYGALVFAALVAALLASNRLRDPARTARQLALMIVVFMLPLLAVGAYFGVVGALDELWSYTVVSLFEETLGSFYKPYPLIGREPLFFTRELGNYTPFQPLAQALIFRRSAAWFIAAIGLAFAIPLAILVLSGVRTAWRWLAGRAQPAELALTLSAIALFGGVFPRSDYHHLILVISFCLLVGGHLVQSLADRLPRPAALSVPVAVGALGYATLSVIAAASVPFAWPRPQDTPLGIERAESIRVDEKLAKALRSTVSYTREHASPDEPIFVLPKDPLLYFLTQRRNPTPFPLALPGSFDEGDLLAALPEVDLVLYTDYGHDDHPLLSLFPDLVAYLERHFSVDEGYLAGLEEAPKTPYPLRRRNQRQPPPGLDLAAGAAQAKATILNPSLGAIGLLGGDRERARSLPWFFRRSLRLRPPSGWQKLAVSYQLEVPPQARLELELSFAPVQQDHPRVDGAVFEIWFYDLESFRLERIWTRYLDPHREGYWRFKEVEIDLAEWAGRDKVLSFVVWGGPSLDEWWDEVWVGAPSIRAPRIRQEASPQRLTALPAGLVSRIAGWRDPTVFEAGVRRRPQNGRLHMNLGMVYSRLGQDERAVGHLERAAALAPGDAEVWLALAEFHWSRGSREDAERAHLALNRLDPANLRALLVLAELHLQDRRDLERARSYALKALRHHHRNAQVFSTLARISLAEGDVEHGVRSITHALGLEPENPVLLELLDRHHPGDKLEIAARRLSRATAPLEAADRRASISAQSPPPSRGAIAAPFEVALEVANLGGATWSALSDSEGRYRVAVRHRWTASSGAIAGEGAHSFSSDVDPGEERTLKIFLSAPTAAGSYRLSFEVVQVAVGPLTEENAASGPFQVDIVSGAES